MGNAGINGGPAGNLRILIRVRPHPFFERDGFNVWYEQEINIAQAALGATVTVPTLDGKVQVDIKPGTQSGDILKLGGKGIPRPYERGKGDQLVRIKVVVPKNLTAQQKDLLTQLAASFGTPNTGKKGTGFFGKKK